MDKKWLTLLKGFSIGYALVCFLLYCQQQRLIFFPSRHLENTPDLYQLEYQDVSITITTTTKAKENIHGWWIPAANSDAPVILYFHHNAVNIGANVSQAKQFHQLGYSIFLFDYRGFGQSEGSFPTETQVYEDAQGVWHYLTQERQIPPQQIIIYGHSVGGAIAIDLATKQPEAAALIVQSSFTSITDMTKRFGLYWLFPVKWLLRQKFASLEKMPLVKMPVLIIQGTKDLQIPVEMGKKLYAVASEAKQLIIIPDGGHDNHLPQKYLQLIKQFIAQEI